MENAIEKAVREIDSHVAKGGWDGPVRVFALIRSAPALAANPELAGQLPADVDLNAAGRDDSLFSVEQEGLPAANSVEELLAQIAWPATVDGAAISLERVTMPSDAEGEIPDDPIEAEAFVARDPRRQDIRMVVGVMRSGESWCTIRMRSHDRDADVLSASDLVPEMIEALSTTFL
ncbi:MAG: PPA1309 family protein [Actinomycetaceae bacterium]|nr:PPA1309 family protein [Actinomycetaceae bacterium]